MKAFGASVAGVGASLGALGASITAPLVLAAKEFADAGSALNDMSTRTGLSVEALSALGFAAKQTGADMATVEGAVKRMQKAMVAGSEENQAAMRSFALLGLDIRRLARLSPEHQFQMIARAIAGIHDPTLKAAASMQIFGKSGTALLPLINEMEHLTGQAKEFGLVMSKEDAAAADELGDSMDLLQAVLSSIAKTIGSALAPSFTAWNVQMSRIGKQVKDFIAANKALVVQVSTVGFGLVAAGAAITVLGGAIVAVGAVIGGIGTIVGALGTVLGLLLSPLGLVAVGFVGMTVAMGKWDDMVAAVAGSAKANLGGMLTTARDTFEGISDALKAGDLRLAAKILFAGLEVEFLEGTTSLAAIWYDWSKDIIKIFSNMKFNIASHMLDIKASLQAVKAEPMATIGMQGPVGVLHGMGDALRGFGLGIGTRIDAAISQARVELIEMIRQGQFEWQKFSNLMTGTFLDAAKHGKSLLAINRAAEAASDAIRKGFEARKAAREAAGAAGPAADAREDAARNEALAEIEGRRRQAQAALDDAERVEGENRRKAAADQIAAARKGLTDARAEFDRLRGRAAEEAGEPEAFGEGGMGQKRLPMTPEGLDEALDKSKSKVEVKGAFGAAGLAGLAAGEDVANKQLDEHKKSNKHLESIDKKVGKAQATFED